MPQIFHRSFNTISKLTIFGAVFILAFLGWVLNVMARSSYVTNVGLARDQPVPFSHEHHVNGLGIDCRYCHRSAEKSWYAGMPATKVCMNCHEQIWVGSSMLEPVRRSWSTDRSLEWNRVHRLAGFVYFNHSVHVNKGVGCAECHGNVNKMPLLWQQGTLLMEWCLDCHRAPESRVRPRDQIYNMDWQHPANDKQAEIAKEYDLHRLIHCSTCHR
jgi:hypothetical protein